jgi:rod shape determining protein RodA
MNWPLFGLMMGLLAYGIYAIHSATWMRDQDFAKSQLIWIVICMPMFFIVSLIDYRWVRFGAIPLYVASILGLVATMFIGEKRYGARSWLDLGPMSFQPSQLAIIAGILTLSLFLSNTRAMPAFLRILCCGAIVGAPWLMILIQPDLGSCIVWVPVLLAMMFVGHIPKRWLILMLVIGLALIPLVVHFGLKPYQYSRITTFLDPEADPLGDGWNITQSLVAIGSGGWFGKGFLEGTQTKGGFVPEQHTDYIFTTVGEEWGFLGSLIVIGLFAGLFLRIIYLAERQKTKFSRIYGQCVAAILFIHFFVNIAMVAGIFPTIGVPLPFFSYGGSGLWGFTILLFIFLKMDANKVNEW